MIIKFQWVEILIRNIFFFHSSYFSNISDSFCRTGSCPVETIRHALRQLADVTDSLITNVTDKYEE
ncbi:MAG: hypothetical protein PHH40_03020 [Candidatus Moranbacteria bacterium]|nr:hypothetical protein [Candidatus Moranbacteria bacterium]MDD3965141.1 hypothetical protein [Candidatus Moranbacteria bacterium]